MELQKDVDGDEVLQHLSFNVEDYFSKRPMLVELCGFLAKQLTGLREDEASCRAGPARSDTESKAVGAMTDGPVIAPALINRFSSRRQRLDHAFLADRLRNAKSYRRIAGYFRSSIFELVGEEIASIPDVRILCNSELDHADIAISKALREQSLKEKWNGVAVETEALLHRERYRRLHELLSSGRVQIRVVPKDRVFIHGKAGVIELADGNKTAFLGSINETKSAFAQNYEILWEDRSPEGVRWVEEEFDALWADSYPLPDAIVEEVARVANRVQVRFEDLGTKDIPAAALAEAPIYRGGEQLQPWQRAFVALFLEHREAYGRTRLLLADEVGLGKTLSMAASALVGSLLGDGPVLGPVSRDADATVAGRVARSPRYSQCRVGVEPQVLDGSGRALHQDERSA